jgi:uncharacterized protein DUF6941
VNAEDFAREPRLLVAAICERVLQETDRALTMVRLIDVVTVASNAPPGVLASVIAEQGAPVQATLALVFKGGAADATHEVRVIAHSPSGAVHEFPPVSAAFSTTIPDSVPGGNVIVSLSMSVKNEGTYWFEVLLDGKSLTAVPLRIVFQAEPSQPQ